MGKMLSDRVDEPLGRVAFGLDHGLEVLLA
jgi:hypothetical protein